MVKHERCAFICRTVYRVNYVGKIDIIIELIEHEMPHKEVQTNFVNYKNMPLSNQKLLVGDPFMPRAISPFL